MTLIPPSYFNAIVAIGEETDNGFRCGATGFLYGHPGDTNDDGSQLYYYTLITNRHVVDPGFSSNAIAKPVARLNLSTGQASPPYSVENWVPHPGTLDVAVAPIDPQRIEELGVDYQLFSGDLNALTREQVEQEAGIREGNGVFVLGFPLELAGQERNYVIARQGILARIQDWIRGDEETFLIDASIFPGNSGGPVITKPEFVSIADYESYSKSSLIGMVSGYRPYNDVAISQQTGQVRVIFQENSGLGVVIPVDAIQETIDHALALANSPS